MASAFQYTLILAHKEGEIETAEGSRGGAALLLNKRSFEAGAENDEITTSQERRRSQIEKLSPAGKTAREEEGKEDRQV